MSRIGNQEVKKSADLYYVVRHAIITCALFVAVAGPVVADGATVYTWIHGDDGNWNAAVNWSGSHIPNGAADQTWIDNDTIRDVTVYSNATVSVSGLRVDIGDTLSINNATGFYLVRDDAANPPVVVNDGTMVLHSTGNYTRLEASGTTATFTGAGELILSGPIANQLNGIIVNDQHHTIRGGGTVNAAIENHGLILADNQILHISGAIDNRDGVLAAGGSGNLLRIGDGSHRITVTGGQVRHNDGTVGLNEGTLIETTLGAGTTRTLAYSTLAGDTELEPGAVVDIPNGQGLALTGNPTITNNGRILIDSTGSITRLGLNVGNTTATFTGNGEVVLSGYPGNQLNADIGATIINAGGHTIRGGGTVTAAIENRGQIIADNQILHISGAIDNRGGILAASGSGNLLRIGDVSHRITVTGGQVRPNNGTVGLNEGTLMETTLGAGTTRTLAYSTLAGDTELEPGAVVDIVNGQGLALTGNPTITNNGRILIDSTGSITRLGLNVGNTTATFTGSGEVVLSGYPGNQLNADIGATIINAGGHTIRGGGTVTAALLNDGRIIADVQTLLFNYPISGNGDVWVADAATLDLRQNAVTGDFYMRAQATLRVAAGRSVSCHENFAFAQTEDAHWGWGSDCTLKMNGEGETWQALEIAGQDLGAVAGGFANNFDLAHLAIDGSGTYVYLTDSIDNGNRSSDEALYVNALAVNPGATLNLNGLTLYTYDGSLPHRVTAGENFGGGAIIDDPSVIAPPDIRVDPNPADIDAGEIGIGETSSIFHVVIENAGMGSIVATDLPVDGDPDFLVNEGDCLTSILGSGEQCTVTIQFAPHAVGLKNAAVAIQSNDPDEPAIVVHLAGKAVCRGDFDDDGDVDGADLAYLAHHSGALDPAVFAANLGGTGCHEI